MDLLDIQQCDTVAFEKFVLQVQSLVGMLMKLGCKIREEKDRKTREQEERQRQQWEQE